LYYPMGNSSATLRSRRTDQTSRKQADEPASTTNTTTTTTQKEMSAPAVSATTPWRTLLEKSLARNRALANARYIQIATIRPDGRPANRTVVFRGFLGASGPAGAAAAASAATSDALTIVTDARSRKVGECAANPRTEVCWYFPQTREQYRISGTLEIVGAAEEGEEAASGDATTTRLALLRAVREHAWQRMSDAGREQFFWPHPGQPRLDGDEAAFLGSGGGGGGDRRGGGGGKQGGKEQQQKEQAAAPPPPPPPPPVPATFCLGLIEPDEVDHVRLKSNRRTRYVLLEGGGGQWSVEELNP
jgi:PPOX class probable FMN-dependent enzyme